LALKSNELSAVEKMVGLTGVLLGKMETRDHCVSVLISFTFEKFPNGRIFNWN
jgi:hypothetical protein